MKDLTIAAVFATALALAPSAAHAQFPASFDLSTLDGTNGFVINGIGFRDLSGLSVSGAGDVNGDGFDDLIIGAFGESYVVFGSDSGFSSSLDLSALNGSNGFQIDAVDGGLAGISVSGAGDVNGDGIDDVIIGASGADPNGNCRAGESYVLFGNSSGFSASLDLSTLDGTNGFLINGIDKNDFSGRSVSGAGDINGDGIDDLIIGARGGGPNGNVRAGESYVVFGSNSGFSSSLDLSTLDGTNGFVINGIDAYDQSGRSVSGAGDVNGDGFDDLIIGAFGAGPNGNDRAGESYVVFGNDSGFSSSLNLSALDGANGFVINGVDEGDGSGCSVSSAGDINEDGFDDVIIAVYAFSPNGSSECYVVFGSDSFSPSIDLSALDGSNGFVVNGLYPINFSCGFSVSGAGDINGDGIDDLIIRELVANQNISGESYVVFGNAGGFSPSFDLSALDGANGFVISGIDSSDNGGAPVSGAGDVNGDGIDDIIIGAPLAEPNGNSYAGESYVVFGRSAPSVIKGDVDMDGDIDFSDIPPFISVLQSGVFQAEADCDCSTVVDFADIPAFINILQEQ